MTNGAAPDPADITLDDLGTATPDTTETPSADPAARFRHLPEPVDPRTLVASIETEAAPDPDGGRDANTEWMLRHG